MTRPLAELEACFQGIVPSVIATCSRGGEPNVTYLSQVHLIDDRRVALSCQFFNKTKQNLLENPFASVVLYDPVTFEAWHLRLRFLHEETSGPLFDQMALRIQAIATHTGMDGVFRLLSADVFEILALEPIPEYLTPPDGAPQAALPATGPGPLTEIRSLQVVSDRIARACHLEALLGSTLQALAEMLEFEHSMILLAEPDGQRLTTIASHGYGEHGIGAEVPLGVGLIGQAAASRRMLCARGLAADLRYARAVRARVQQSGLPMAPEIPLPGLADAQAQLALPMLVGDRLIGVLAVESRDPMRFDPWHESFLQIVANQIAAGIERMQQPEDDEGAPAPIAATNPPQHAPVRTFVYYRNDDCVFVDGEYLVRNVPGRILWKLLREHGADGRVEFTNRELRLDSSLGLPAYKDNLESRLILLRKRLLEKCPDVQLVPVRRGRFSLALTCRPKLVEKESG